MSLNSSVCSDSKNSFIFFCQVVQMRDLDLLDVLKSVPVHVAMEERAKIFISNPIGSLGVQLGKD